MVLSRQLDDYLEHFAPIAAYSEGISLTAVVAAITYLSLVVGELVPKRIGLNHPERIASLVAGPMHTLSVVASPLVKLLSASTEGLLRLLGFRKAEEPLVTEEEVAALLEAGTEAGVLEEDEHELVERVFWLGDQRAESLMTPRHKLVWLNVDDPRGSTPRPAVYQGPERPFGRAATAALVLISSEPIVGGPGRGPSANLLSPQLVSVAGT
jgi:putative hemolysin